MSKLDEYRAQAQEENPRPSPRPEPAPQGPGPKTINPDGPGRPTREQVEEAEAMAQAQAAFDVVMANREQLIITGTLMAQSAFEERFQVSGDFIPFSQREARDLSNAADPVIRKYIGDGAISPEFALLAVTAMLVVPRLLEARKRIMAKVESVQDEGATFAEPPTEGPDPREAEIEALKAKVKAEKEKAKKAREKLKKIKSKK